MSTCGDAPPVTECASCGSKEGTAAGCSWGGYHGDPGSEWEGQWFCDACWHAWAKEQWPYSAQLAETSTVASDARSESDFYGDDYSSFAQLDSEPVIEGFEGDLASVLHTRCAELGSEENLTAALELCLREEAPRVIWTYWDQGCAEVPPFNALCIETWQARNPGWRVVILDHWTVKDVLQPDDLPQEFDSPGMLCQHRADCARLALLRRFGGVYMDSSVLALQALEGVLDWTAMERGHIDFAGYFLGDTAYVENYILACRRGSPLVCQWQSMCLEYWRAHEFATERSEATVPGPSPPEETCFKSFFSGVDLSVISPEHQHYLVQHACYKKLLDLDVDGFRGLTRRAQLLDAASPVGALWLFKRLKEDARVILRSNCADEPPQVPYGVNWAIDLQRLCAERGIISPAGCWVWGQNGQGKEFQLNFYDGVPQLTPDPEKVDFPLNVVQYLEVPDEILGEIMADRLLNSVDDELIRDVFDSGIPLAKFTGTVGRFLEMETWEGLLGRPNTLRCLFQAALTEEETQ